MELRDKTLIAVYLVLLVQPAAVLVWTWWKQTRPASQLDRPSAALLALTTASYAFLWIGGVLYRPLLGPDYSDRLYATIEINLAANVLLAIIGALHRGSWRQRICLSGSPGLVALAWLCVAAVNSTV